MSFSESTVVITGASRGVGRNIALLFSRETSHALFLLARNRDDLEKVKQECLDAGAENVEVSDCDLTSESEVSSLQIPKSLPTPAILINNAGSFLFKTLEDTTPAEFEKQWVINSKLPFLVTRRFLPEIRTQPRGLIATITSIAALSGQSGSGAYASSKHATLGFSRSLRKELQGTNISVTSINMGQTMSTSWKGMDVDPDELNDPEDIGRFIVGLTHLSPRTVVEEVTIRPIGGDREAN